jgi:uncharacterized protein with NRDE domain
VCLIACAWRADPRFELLLIANRDEYHARPTAPAAPLSDTPHVIGGRDLQAGGSWLQFSTRGRLAAVTNLRHGVAPVNRPRSRGALVSAFVRGSTTVSEFTVPLVSTADEYGYFNLLLWDRLSLQLATNHPGFGSLGLGPGLHVLSNGPFNARWPKTERIRAGMRDWLDAAPADDGAFDASRLFALLGDRSAALDEALPDTGIGLERERFLAPIFIAHPLYGTRCSTVLAMTADGRWWFEERRFGADGVAIGASGFSGDP